MRCGDVTDVEQRRVRGKEIAVIFQEPMTALNPVYTVGFQIMEALRSHFPIGPDEAKERALDLLRKVDAGTRMWPSTSTRTSFPGPAPASP